MFHHCVLSGMLLALQWRNNTLQIEWEVRSHICPDHPRCATPTKVVVCGGVPDIVNLTMPSFIKIGSGNLAPWGLEIYLFLFLALWLYNAQPVMFIFDRARFERTQNSVYEPKLQHDATPSWPVERAAFFGECTFKGLRQCNNQSV